MHDVVRRLGLQEGCRDHGVGATCERDAFVQAREGRGLVKTNTSDRGDACTASKRRN